MIRPLVASIRKSIGDPIDHWDWLWGSFDIKSLFANGEQGWWFDNSDLSTLFQDAAGTTPVTAAGQPVGLMLDKSRGLVRGAELITNGDFSGGTTGWTLSGAAAVVGGALSVSAETAGAIFATNTGQFVAGRSYEVSFTISTIQGGGVSVSVPGGAASTIVRATAGTFTEIFIPAVSNSIAFVARSGPTTATLDNISVRELPGNHRFQATAASRPILRKNATTGAYYFETDGTDDWMQTNSINFTGTDKVSVFTAVRKLSDAATATVAELGSDSNTVNGSFGVLAPSAGGTNKFTFATRGTAAVYALTTDPAFSAPYSAVLRCESDIPGDYARLGINGLLAGTTRNDQGSGKYGNFPAYFFRRAGTTLPFNGHEYGSICVGRLCTESEIRGIELILARKVGVTLA